MREKITKLFKRNGQLESAATLLPVGRSSPDFTLLASDGDQITLSQLRGRPVVLVFYPADNSSVCSSQLALYNEAHHLFEEYGAQVLGISIDGLDSHRAFANSLDLRFPLLADDDPPGSVSKLYGALNGKDGKSERALYVIDAEGLIRWSYLSPRSVNPGAQGILQTLESLPDLSPASL